VSADLALVPTDEGSSTGVGQSVETALNPFEPAVDVPSQDRRSKEFGSLTIRAGLARLGYFCVRQLLPACLKPQSCVTSPVELRYLVELASSRMRRDFKIKLIAAALIVAVMGLLPGERAAARPPVEKPSVAEMLCSIVLTEARKQGLPETFFTRLIWKESLFDPKAVSPKGAQGIAQFMPGTARDRGLADPFLAGQALAASAHLLSELRATFGNLGLAAAAYNAGADRVRSWLLGLAELPL
jgi:Transglycosylase SLT domain